MHNVLYGIYNDSVSCRVISSGQSHQLSTGTVKKPTSPVGFFTSGFWCIVLMLDEKGFPPVRTTNSAPEQ
ncbi:hypothetical protein EC465_17980 [Salmonella enterica subsp. enterica serovar Muenchen]|nr:hypothetical protein [Salmonella enterica subsp. enterica serovar Muenchen]